MGADIGCPGIYPYQDVTLTIKGSGSLEALGNYNAPGIGSGPEHKGFDTAGNVVIEGGTIIARGGMDAPSNFFAGMFGAFGIFTYICRREVTNQVLPKN